MKTIRIKKLCFSIVLAALVIAAIEVVLRVAAIVSPTVDLLLSTADTQTVLDSRLGYRPHPAVSGHDRNGFRNPEVPAASDIVALGDSQTYGTGVEPSSAWPRKLETLTGKSVYGMAYGGYGPVHSLILWPEAVKLEPQIVLHGFYAGNDYFDSYNLVYNLGQFPELKTSDLRLQEEIRETESVEPITTKINKLLNAGEPKNEVSAARLFLSNNLKIYGLLRQIGNISTIISDANASKLTSDEEWANAKAFADAHSQYCQKFDDGQFRTIFTSEYRLAGVDLNDPRIAEGLQISLRAIKMINERARERNIRYVVMMIPSRENVFSELWKNSTNNYRLVIENEERSRQITKEFLDYNGIEYLDLLQDLKGEFAKGAQPYFVSADGHPNEAGHEAIAKCAAEHIYR